MKPEAQPSGGNGRVGTEFGSYLYGAVTEARWGISANVITLLTHWQLFPNHPEMACWTGDQGLLQW